MWKGAADTLLSVLNLLWFVVVLDRLAPLLVLFLRPGLGSGVAIQVVIGGFAAVMGG